MSNNEKAVHKRWKSTNFIISTVKIQKLGLNAPLKLESPKFVVIATCRYNDNISFQQH